MRHEQVCTSEKTGAPWLCGAGSGASQTTSSSVGVICACLALRYRFRPRVLRCSRLPTWEGRMQTTSANLAETISEKLRNWDAPLSLSPSHPTYRPTHRPTYPSTGLPIDRPTGAAHSRMRGLAAHKKCLNPRRHNNRTKMNEITRDARRSTRTRITTKTIRRRRNSKPREGEENARTCVSTPYSNACKPPPSPVPSPSRAPISALYCTSYCSMIVRYLGGIPRLGRKVLVTLREELLFDHAALFFIQ